MDIIKFTVKGQHLVLNTDLRKRVITSDTINQFKCQFVFDDSWDGYNIRVYFKNANFNITKATLLDSSGYCYIPWEVLAHTGVLMCNVAGDKYDGTELVGRLTTDTVRFFLKNTSEGAYESSYTSNPTPSEFEQFVAQVHLDAENAEIAEQKVSNMTVSSETGSPTSVTKVDYPDHYDLHFVLPDSSEEAVTDVQVDNVSVVDDGIATIPKATYNQYGLVKVINGNPEGYNTFMGIISRDNDSVRFPTLDGSYELSPSVIPAATTTTKGAMSATDKVKLDGIASGAEVNVQSDWNESDSSSDAYIANKPTVYAGIPYYTCSSSGSSMMKQLVAVSSPLTAITTGCSILVKFSNVNTAQQPFLTFPDETWTEYAIQRGSTRLGLASGDSWHANEVVMLTFDGTAWQLNDWNNLDIHNVPSGGTSGQVLSKASGTDYDVEWITPSGGGTITDVQVNGTSVVSSGIATIPKANASTFGVVETISNTSGTNQYLEIKSDGVDEYVPTLDALNKITDVYLPTATSSKKGAVIVSQTYEPGSAFLDITYGSSYYLTDKAARVPLLAYDSYTQTYKPIMPKYLPDFVGTDGNTAGTKGVVPAPATTDANKFLKSDGTWAAVSGGGTITDVKVDTSSVVSGGVATIPLSDSSHKGVIKMTGHTGSPVERYVSLEGNTTYDVPYLNNNEINRWHLPLFTGTDGNLSGSRGIVPAPLSTDAGKYLKADGTWATVNCDVTDVQSDGSSVVSSTVAIIPKAKYNTFGTVKAHWNGDPPAGYLMVVTDNASNATVCVPAIEKNGVPDLTNSGTVRAKWLPKATTTSYGTVMVGISGALVEHNATRITTDDGYANIPALDGNNKIASAQLPDFVGTDGNTAGTKGAVPAPATTDAGKFLKADGTWTAISIPTKVSDLTNDSGYITSYTETDPVFTASAAYGITSSDISNWNGKSDFSGNYNDLTNKPTIPTVNNATLTIQKNGTNVQTFTANASSNATANITVHDVPSGGTADQVLAKNSSTDYDLKWTTVSGGSSTLVQIVRWS